MYVCGCGSSFSIALVHTHISSEGLQLYRTLTAHRENMTAVFITRVEVGTNRMYVNALHMMTICYGLLLVDGRPKCTSETENKRAPLSRSAIAHIARRERVHAYTK